MNYHLHHQGADLGIVSLEDLRRRRGAGELSGQELVWADGMTEWESLDSVLARLDASASPPPVQRPPLPLLQETNAPVAAAPTTAAVARPARRGAALWFAAAGLIFLAGTWLAIRTLQGGPPEDLSEPGPGLKVKRPRPRPDQPPTPEMVLQAALQSDEVPGELTRPIAPSTNTVTVMSLRPNARAFRTRQWLEGYKDRGERGHALNAEGVQMIERWLAHNYEAPDTNYAGLTALADRIASTPGVGDPVLLSVAALLTENHEHQLDRLQRALDGYDQSSHRRYPKFFTAVTLLNEGGFTEERAPLFIVAGKAFEETLQDGSVLPEDQSEMAEILIDGWGSEYFKRFGQKIATVANLSGPKFAWLAEMLKGQNYVKAAWRARGEGLASTVTEEGWKEFALGLSFAEKHFTTAWKMRPDWPLAAAQMIAVSMGQGGDEMRLWFDRAVAAQIDHPRSWNNLRWGLRARWHGGPEAQLALGKLAVETGRFDTDVPRKLMDCLADLEADVGVQRGEHVYGRPEIWPLIDKMYRGYIAEPTETKNRNGWRSAYAMVAYLAQRYDVARAQLEALNWSPSEQQFAGWGRDVSIMPLEVAARTGSAADEVASAERRRSSLNYQSAIAKFRELAARYELDPRSRQFARHRAAELDLELQFSKDDWINLGPTAPEDPAWRTEGGRFLPGTDNNNVAVESGPNGFMMVCQARFTPWFEIRGTIERPEGTDSPLGFGIAYGEPSLQNSCWNSIRFIAADEGRTDPQIRFSNVWSKEGTTAPVPLPAGTNSFHFIVREGDVTISVNGRPVLLNFHPTGAMAILPSEHRIALTGKTAPKAVVRYRNLQIRRLR